MLKQKRSRRENAPTRSIGDRESGIIARAALDARKHVLQSMELRALLNIRLQNINGFCGVYFPSCEVDYTNITSILTTVHED